MSRLDQLPRIANELFADVHADAALRQRILAHQAPRRGYVARTFIGRAAPVFTAIVLLLGITALVAGPLAALQTMGGAGIETRAAGQATAEPVLKAGADIPDDALTITSGTASKFKSLFASGQDGNFPLVGYNGHAYRLMSGSVSNKALGNSLGTVSLFTNEPALADSSQWLDLLSNVAEEGAEVYAIDGLSTGTAVAATVDGKTRLFQRVSFAGYGSDSNSLADALAIRGKVSALDLSGVGAIEDRDTANALIDTLLDNARLAGDDMPRGKQGLTITLSSGLKLQLLISGEQLGACGTWDCAEFFEAYRAALANEGN